MGFPHKHQEWAPSQHPVTSEFLVLFDRFNHLIHGLSKKYSTSDICTVFWKCQNLNVIFKDTFKLDFPFIKKNIPFYICVLDASPINKTFFPLHFSYALLYGRFLFENKNQRLNEIKGLYCFLANFTVSFLICVCMWGSGCRWCDSPQYVLRTWNDNKDMQMKDIIWKDAKISNFTIAENKLMCPANCSENHQEM